MNKSSRKASNAATDSQYCPSSSHSHKFTKMSNKIYIPSISDVINLYICISSFWGLFHLIIFLHPCCTVRGQRIIIRNLLLVRLTHFIYLLCQNWPVRFLNGARWVFLCITAIKDTNNEKAKTCYTLSIPIPLTYFLCLSVQLKEPPMVGYQY